MGKQPEGLLDQVRDYIRRRHYSLTRGLTNGRTEMSLTMLAYSIKRVIRILGVSRMVAALAV